MSSLVIGGTGLLGGALCEALRSAGERVRATVRDSSPAEAVSRLKRLGVETVAADLRDGRSIDGSLDGVDRVFMAAALFKTWLPDLEEFDRVNVDGLRTALDACLRRRVRRVVYTSSHATIGLARYPGFADESTPVLPWQERLSPYVASKFAAERLVSAYCGKGLDIVVANPVGMIGVNDHGLNPTNKYIRGAAAGHAPALCVGAYTCLVDSRDAAEGHLLAMEKGRTGHRYLLGGDNITFQDYFSQLRRLAGVPGRPLRLPLAALLAASYALECKAALSGGVPSLTPGSVRFLGRGTRYSSRKAQEELGYRFRPAGEAIEQAFRWAQAHPTGGATA